MVGERDPRYWGIAARMHALLPVSELAAVPGAGHTVHVDQPDAFVGLLRSAMTRSHDALPVK